VSDSLSALFALEQFGIKFGLDNIRALLARLDHPERAFQSIHVAGTNGKGSVTAMVDAALRAAGYRAGRYTSPHLIDLSERFVIDGQPVAPEPLKDAVATVLDAAAALQREGVLEAPPTFFEATTATAFELFRRAHVQVAVLEVGLGGRLDATNVVTPLVCAITSIAFDHEAYLGSTLREIAMEKAGIVKPGVPVVVGELDVEAMAAVEGVARERGAPLIRSSPADVAFSAIGLPGRHQVANAAIAVRVLETLGARGFPVDAAAIGSGLASPGWPGRLDRRQLADGREMLLDAAHNPAGARALASYLREHAMDGAPLVFGVMRDKDVDGIIGAIAPAVGHMVLTRASSARSADPEALADRVRAIAPTLPWTVAPSVSRALEEAWRLAPRIVVAGSIFLLGAVMEEMGWQANGER
jgi:dihydrofolate synthase/folylpolyglutamate synthase